MYPEASLFKAGCELFLAIQSTYTEALEDRTGWGVIALNNRIAGLLHHMEAYFMV